MSTKVFVYPDPDEKDWDRLPATAKQANAILAICRKRRLNPPYIENMSKRQASEWLGRNSEGRICK